jgi:hypothetical protein
MDKLKPCPFCGEQAQLIVRNDLYCNYAVGCSNEDCQLKNLANYAPGWFLKNNAIDAWNIRTYPPEVVELVKLTRGLLGILTPKQRKRQFPNIVWETENALKPFEE